MIQLVQPNLSIIGRIAWCLEYTRKMFGAPVVEPTAWSAWEASQFKHFDAVPTDVAVPCWFEYPVGSQGPGHVVDSVPGKGFYSSPYSTYTTAQYQQGNNTRAVLPSIAEVERLYHCKYVGWSEDISGVRVVMEGDDMQSQIEELNAQLNQTNIYVDALEKRVLTLEQASTPLPSDGTYELKKIA